MVLEVVNASPFLGADHGKGKYVGIEFLHIHKVSLVVNANALFAFSQFTHFVKFLVCWRSIHQPENDAGFLDFLHGALNTHLFHFVRGLPNTGSIDEAELEPIDFHGIFNGVAGGAMDVADKGTIVTQKAVEQGGFANIGLANDGDRDAIAQGLANFKRVGELLDAIVNLVG